MTKSLHTLCVRVPITGIEPGKLAVLKIGKAVHSMGTPNVINVIEKFKGQAPIVKINYPTDSLGVIIEGSGNPMYCKTMLFLITIKKVDKASW